MEVVELCVWQRLKGNGPRKLLHKQLKEIPDPSKRDRVIRQMLATADDHFSDTKGKRLWKEYHA